MIVITIVLVSSLSVQGVYAASPTGTPKPGWGHGDKNHVHTGPPGVSVRSNDNVTVNNIVSVTANTGAKVMVNIVTNIYHSIFGN